VDGSAFGSDQESSKKLTFSAVGGGRGGWGEAARQFIMQCCNMHIMLAYRKLQSTRQVSLEAAITKCSQKRNGSTLFTCVFIYCVSPQGNPALGKVDEEKTITSACYTGL